MGSSEVIKEEASKEKRENGPVKWVNQHPNRSKYITHVDKPYSWDESSALETRKKIFSEQGRMIVGEGESGSVAFAQTCVSL